MPKRLPDTLIDDADDGLPLLPIKKHTKEKLLCLMRHYAFFTRIINAKFPQSPRWYVDLFSGPGKCRFEETGEVKKGSPLIALNTQPPFTDFAFVEKDPEYFSALQSRCSSHPHVNMLEGDANIIAPNALAMIGPHDPCLVLVDPFELELEWSTVAQLAEKPRIDLLINFQVSQVFRSFGLGSYDRLDRFFGPNNWKPIEKRWKENVPPAVIRSELFELYKEGLEKNGLKAVPKLIYAESTNSPLYYLIYAVRFPIGEKVWKAVAKPRISKYTTLDGSEVTVYE